MTTVDELITRVLPPPSHMSARVAQSIRLDAEACLALAAVSQVPLDDQYYRRVAAELRECAEDMARRPPHQVSKQCAGCCAYSVCLLAREHRESECAIGPL